MRERCTKSGGAGISLFLALLLAGAGPAALPQDAARQERPDWPRVIDAPGATLTLYPPQLDSLKGERIQLRLAVSEARAGIAAPRFGAVWVEGKLVTDPGRGITVPVELALTASRFPSATPAQAAQIRQAITADLPHWGLACSLDQLFAELKLAEGRKAQAAGLLADPPAIRMVSHPAVLLPIDGEPEWRYPEGALYFRLVNTTPFVVQDPTSGACYLNLPPFWWTSTSPLGPWRALEAPPRPVAELAASEAGPEPASPAAPLARPEVIVATEPTELVVTQGPPQYSPITGTNLLYVTNTDSDLFVDARSQALYVLLSGRWFRQGPGSEAWTFVPAEDLPRDFARIPLSSEKQHVLASVSGTPQSRQSALDLDIPRTAAVPVGPAPGIGVTYDGDPQFADVPGGEVAYAVNSISAVFRVLGRYYLCQDGIWFVSDYPWGPWSVCPNVPPVIYLVPPSCPDYYCVYSTVLGATSDVVYFGCTPGYFGCYLLGGIPVFGTGWRYHPWNGHDWFPRPATWGFGACFDRPHGSFKIRLGAPRLPSGGTENRPFSGPASFARVGAGGAWGGVGFQLGRMALPSALNRETSSPPAAAPRVDPHPLPPNPGLKVRESQAPGAPPPAPSRSLWTDGGGPPPSRGGEESPRTGNVFPGSNRPTAPPQRAEPEGPAPRREAPRSIESEPRRTPPPEVRESPRTPPPPPERRESPQPPAPPPPAASGGRHTSISAPIAPAGAPPSLGGMRGGR